MQYRTGFHRSQCPSLLCLAPLWMAPSLSPPFGRRTLACFGLKRIFIGHKWLTSGTDLKLSTRYLQLWAWHAGNTLCDYNSLQWTLYTNVEQCRLCLCYGQLIENSSFSHLMKCSLAGESVIRKALAKEWFHHPTNTSNLTSITSSRIQWISGNFLPFIQILYSCYFFE